MVVFVVSGTDVERIRYIFAVFSGICKNIIIRIEVVFAVIGGNFKFYFIFTFNEIKRNIVFYVAVFTRPRAYCFAVDFHDSRSV